MAGRTGRYLVDGKWGGSFPDTARHRPVPTLSPAYHIPFTTYRGETRHRRYETAQAKGQGIPLAMSSYCFGLFAGLEAEGAPVRVALGVAGPPVVGTSTGFAASYSFTIWSVRSTSLAA